MSSVTVLLEYLILTLGFKVRSIFLDFCCNLPMICNNCGDYVYTRSKNKRGIQILSGSQVCMCDLDL